MPLILVLLCLTARMSAAVVTVYWTGTITDFFYFGGETPAGVGNGVPISGELVVDIDQYVAHGRQLGTDSFGDTYRYNESATLRFNVTSSEWLIVGGDISLLNYVRQPMQAFDAYSISARNSAILFPGYVGSFEAGFALFAEDSPFSLFDTTDIESAIFDFENPTSGGGFVTTRRYDQNNDIVEGYYLTFEINESSSSPVPEPSVPLLLVMTTCAALTRRFRPPSKAASPSGARMGSGMNPRPREAGSFKLSFSGAVGIFPA